MVRRRRLAAVGLSAITALTLTGCLQDPGSSGGGTAGLEGFVDNNQDDGDGVVTILGAYGGDEKENFEKALVAFEEETGIDIQYTEDTDFTTTIKTRVAASDTPDIGFFPQPGGLLELAADGNIQPIDTFLDYDSLDESLVPGLLDYTNLNGRNYGAPVRLANKSIVWYPKKAFEDGGYEVPKTLDELYDLADQLQTDGLEPWCMAWNADQATGWVGTDWVEQLMLTVNGPEVYNEWIYHGIPFDDDQVVAAFDAFSQIAREEGKVYGGADTVVSTQVAESMVPAFRDPAECMLERQGSFEVSFLAPEIQEDLDNQIGVFTFPPAEEVPGEAPPVLVGADYAALFNGNDDEAMQVMEFLTSDDFGAEWAQAGGWLSPHKTFDTENYPNQTTKDIAAIATDASEAVFDGSDVMPKEVGSGSFWSGMVKWIQGESSEDTTSEIESTWPE